MKNDQNFGESVQVTRKIQNKSVRKAPLIFILLAAAILGFSFGGYFFWENMQLKNNPSGVAQKEAERVVKKLGKIVLLPEEEFPVVATVTDPDLLKSQPFFSKAKEGDRLVVYNQAGIAILYDDKEEKIIQMTQFDAGTASGDRPATEPVRGGEEDSQIEEDN